MWVKSKESESLSFICKQRWTNGRNASDLSFQCRICLKERYDRLWLVSRHQSPTAVISIMWANWDGCTVGLTIIIQLSFSFFFLRKNGLLREKTEKWLKCLALYRVTKKNTYNVLDRLRCKMYEYPSNMRRSSLVRTLGTRGLTSSINFRELILADIAK